MFYGKCDETMAQISQRGGCCPIPGNIEGQVQWGSEQPELVLDVPVQCRRVGLDAI